MTPTLLGVGGFPAALTAVSAASIVIGFACAVGLAVDVGHRPQPMRVMSVVWPLTALFGGVPWTAFYYRWARAPRRGSKGPESTHPRIVAVAISTSHCGAGCALADLVVEWLVFAVPALAVAGGLGLIFDQRIFASWVLDFVAAFLIGIAFQYAAIAPSRGIRGWAAWKAAIRADAASIAAWQIGMYGAMAIAQFAVFGVLFGGQASVASPEFWFAMQWAMIIGFLTAFPVNALLIRRGTKEAM
ncbi:MAG: DUF4396 domain-containing protein [Acidobacteria bacterium]|nr:DUF4396 domain-containing protein [Acidobacteriota bacterium]